MSEIIKSKSSVSNDYIKSWIEKTKGYTQRTTEKSNVVILGGRYGNIGGEICRTLTADGYNAITMWDRVHGDLNLVNPDLYALYKNTDILIMCQGNTHIDWIENQLMPDIQEQIQDSLISHIRQTREFVKQTIDKPYRKTIIYVGSMAYRNILNGSSVYCAAKAGLNMFARCMAWELAPKGYDVYIIHPGNVEGSPMAESTKKQLMRYRNLTPLEAELYWNTGNPRNTILTAHDIAILVSTICDGTMVYAAGNPIDLTGGQR